MNYNSLKDAIAQVIGSNDNQEITGQVLQNVLHTMINALANGYIFAGVATPATSPGNPDQNMFWIGGPGAYANFGEPVFVVPSYGIAIFTYNGSFTREVISFAVDSTPTENSNNLITSGAVASAIASALTAVATVTEQLALRINKKADIVELSNYVEVNTSALPKSGNYVWQGNSVESRIFTRDNNGTTIFCQAFALSRGDSSSNEFGISITDCLLYESSNAYAEFTFIGRYQGSNIPDFILKAFGKSVATTTSDGLLSKEDKEILDKTAARIDVYNVNYHQSTEYGYTFASAIALVPEALKHIGMVVTYRKYGTNNEWESKQFVDGNISTWTTESNWVDFGGGSADKISFDNSDNGFTATNVQGAIEKIGKYVSDDELMRVYTDSEDRLLLGIKPDGSLYPSAPKTKMLVKGAFLGSQMTDEDVVYIVRYDFNLGGRTLTVPANCTLRFEGGSIYNGTMKFNNTRFEGDVKCYVDIDTYGSIENPVVDLTWFTRGCNNPKIDSGKTILQLIYVLTYIGEIVHAITRPSQTLYVPKGFYYVNDNPIDIDFNNNKTIPEDFSYCYVCIKGDGKGQSVIVDNHSGTAWDYLFGIKSDPNIKTARFLMSDIGFSAEYKSKITVHLPRASHSIFSGCFFGNAKMVNFFTSESYSTSFVSCFFHSGTVYYSEYGFFGHGSCNAIQFRSCYFSAYVGLYMQNGLSDSIDGNTFEGCKSCAIYLHSGQSTVICNNYFEDNGERWRSGGTPESNAKSGYTVGYYYNGSVYQSLANTFEINADIVINGSLLSKNYRINYYGNNWKSGVLTLSNLNRNIVIENNSSQRKLQYKPSSVEYIYRCSTFVFSTCSDNINMRNNKVIMLENSIPEGAYELNMLVCAAIDGKMSVKGIKMENNFRRYLYGEKESEIFDKPTIIQIALQGEACDTYGVIEAGNVFFGEVVRGQSILPYSSIEQKTDAAVSIVSGTNSANYYKGRGVIESLTDGGYDKLELSINNGCGVKKGDVVEFRFWLNSSSDIIAFIENDKELTINGKEGGYTLYSLLFVCTSEHSNIEFTLKTDSKFYITTPEISVNNGIK